MTLEYISDTTPKKLLLEYNLDNLESNPRI